MAELYSRLKDADPTETRSAYEKGSELENSINEFNSAWDRYSEQWSKDNPGKEWDGDGSEFHEELLRKYPEYKKINDNRDRLAADYIKECLRLIKTDAFKDLKNSKKYENYFDYYINYENNEERYHVGNIAAYALANVVLPNWHKIDFIDPMWFVETYDKNGKYTGNPRLG